MATCPACGGRGGSDGNYLPCYSCGGRGTAMTIHTPCNACGGSGRGSQRQWNACPTCGGSGRVADDRPAGAAPARRRGKPPARPAEPWTRWHLLVAGAAYVVIVAYLIEGRGLSGWLPFLVAALPALLIGKQWKALLMLGAIVAGVGLVVSLLLRSGWLGG